MEDKLNLKIRISRINSSEKDIRLPDYATNGSSGMDLSAAIAGDISVKPGETVLIPTGFQVEIPEGYEGQVRPRSGLAVTKNIGVLNSPGTIDSDYRGEIKVILTNFGSKDFIVHRGDRIAQLVVCPVMRIQWEEAEKIDETPRGTGGFGHTGR